MKISILTADVSNNSFGRAWLLATLLRRRYEVEVIGEASKGTIWPPLSDACDFQTTIVRRDRRRFTRAAKLLESIAGDVIYASKPVVGSYGVGLLKRAATGRPLVLDIDDWEPGFRARDGRSLNPLRREWRPPAHLRAGVLSRLCPMLARIPGCANAITVSGPTLQARYGGTIIWHARDAASTRSTHLDREKLKQRILGTELARRQVLGFIGTPRAHKGLDDLIEAFRLLRSRECVLLIVGLDDGHYSSRLRESVADLRIQDRTILLPQQPFTVLPELLSVVDVVIVPQRIRPQSYGQVPAKLFDAMAMAKPIVGTRVHDIPRVLEGCGWIAEPENPMRLAEVIDYVLAHPAEARQMGSRALTKFEREYSVEAVRSVLVSVFERFEHDKR